MKKITKHRYRALGLVVVAVMAFSGVAAASASALSWYTVNPSTGTKEALPGATANVEPSVKPETVFTLVGVVGETPIEITASKLEGIETKITQSGTEAKDSGKLFFPLAGLKVVKPSTCTPPTAGITTTALNSVLVPKTVGALRTKAELTEGKEGRIPSGLTDKFLPASGEIFASFKLAGSCAIAGTVIQVKTTKGVFAETNPVGTSASPQPLVFSQGINENAGGNLFTGLKEATLTGSGQNVLTTTGVAGRKFGAE
jgi:hypothetical protein